MEFGFLAKNIVNDLHDVGNWKSRATAIDNLQKALHDVQDSAQLLPGLPQFLQFILTLVSDPNFKIAISSVQILGELVAKVGKHIEPYLRAVVVNLVEKFTDSKILVRSATVRMLKRLMGVLPVSQVVDALAASGMTHTNWKVREQVVDAATMASTQHAQGQGDYSSVCRLLCQGMTDSKDRVRWVSLEGLAMLGHVMGHPQLLGMLAGSTLSESLRKQVAQRLQQPGLPSVNLDGIVQHVSEQGTSGSDRVGFNGLQAASSNGAPSTQLPWDAGPLVARGRPRLASDPWAAAQPGITSNQESAPTSSASGAVSSPQQPAQWAPAPVRNPHAAAGHMPGHEVASQHPASLWSPSHSLQPASQGNGASHALQPGFQSSSTGPPPASRRPNASMLEPAGTGSTVDSGDALLRFQAQLVQQASSGSSLLSPSEGTPSPQHHHLPQQGSVHSTRGDTQQPLSPSTSVQTRLAGLKNLRSSGNGIPSPSQGVSQQPAAHVNSPVHAELEGQGPLTPSRVYRSLFSGPSSSGPAPSTLPMGDSPITTDTLSTGTLAFASSTLHGGTSTLVSATIDPVGISAAMGSGATLGHTGDMGSYAKRHMMGSSLTLVPPAPTVDHLSLETGSYASQAASNIHNGVTQQPGLGMWLNTELEHDHSAGSGRQETYSPSKGALLANLKKRQIEKRAKSAQLPMRPGEEGAEGLSSPSVRDGSEVDTPGSVDGRLHFGSPFAASRPLPTHMEGDFSSAFSKAVQAASPVQPVGMTQPQLQPSISNRSNSGGMHAAAHAAVASSGYGRVSETNAAGGGAYRGGGVITAGPGLMNAPGSPLGFLASRRARGAPSPLPGLPPPVNVMPPPITGGATLLPGAAPIQRHEPAWQTIPGRPIEGSNGGAQTAPGALISHASHSLFSPVASKTEAQQLSVVPGGYADRMQVASSPKVAAALSRLTPQLRTRSADMHVAAQQLEAAVANSRVSGPATPIKGQYSGVGSNSAGSSSAAGQLQPPGGAATVQSGWPRTPEKDKQLPAAQQGSPPMWEKAVRTPGKDKPPTAQQSTATYWEKGAQTPERDKPSSAQQVGTPYWEKGTKPLEELSVDELTPVQDPDRTFRAVVSKLVEANNADRKAIDWQGQYEALNDARRLVKHHPDTVRANLHELVRAAAPTVDALRSLCVKNVLNLLAELFSSLGRGAMDRELDEVVPLLLKKAGDISIAGRENWLAAEADRVLAEMCKACGEQRTISALTACASHKSMHVRAKVASHLDGLLELNPGMVKALAAGSTALLERLFRTAAGFLDEGALESRTYGKRIVWGIRQGLDSRGEFERLVALVQPEQLVKKVMDVVDSSNGPPPPPSRAAGGSRSVSRQLSSEASRPYPGGPLGVMNGVLSGAAPQMGGPGSPGPGAGHKPTYSISAPVGNTHSVTDSPVQHGGAGTASDARAIEKRSSWRDRASPVRLRARPSMNSNTASPASAAADGAAAGAGFSEADAETISKSLTSMASKDFRERLEGLTAVRGLARQSGVLATATEQQLVPLLDAMTARLSDGNAKVATAALECLRDVCTALRDRIAPGLNTLVPALAGALGASNDKVRAAAAAAADQLLASCDAAYLVQHWAHCVAAGPPHLRGKPLVVERLQALLRALWGVGRTQLVIKHGLPAMFTLLNDVRGEGKAAAQALLSTVIGLMGPSLLEHTVSLQPALQQRIADALSGSKAPSR